MKYACQDNRMDGHCHHRGTQMPPELSVIPERITEEPLKMSSHTTNSATLMSSADGVWNTPPPYFNPFTLQSWVTFMVLGPVFINFADGCIRRSLFTPQTTTTTTTTTLPPTPAPPIDETTGTTMSTSHKQACLEEEIQEINCLHGGTCYAVVVNDNRQSLCHCTAEWSGQRCEQVYIDPGILANMEQNMRTANIAAGVSVCILVLFVLLLALYVHLRKKRKGSRSARDQEENESLEPNGRAGEGQQPTGPPTNCHVRVTIDADGAMKPPSGELPPPYTPTDDKQTKPQPHDVIQPVMCTAVISPGIESTL